jgi:hypothetical protein
MLMRRHWSIALALTLATATACSDTAGPSAESRAAAGIYVLQPTDEQYTPESGTIYLMPTGKAERHVTYRFEGQPSFERVAKGTFRVEGSTLYLELVEQDTDIVYTWRPMGTIDGPTLTISYPGPADGTVTEIYRR